MELILISFKKQKPPCSSFYHCKMNGSLHTKIHFFITGIAIMIELQYQLYLQGNLLMTVSILKSRPGMHVWKDLARLIING